MSDDLRNPIGAIVDDEDGSTVGEITEEDYEEVDEMNDEQADEPG